MNLQKTGCLLMWVGFFMVFITSSFVNRKEYMDICYILGSVFFVGGFLLFLFNKKWLPESSFCQISGEYPTVSERIWAMLCHLSVFVFLLLCPLFGHIFGPMILLFINRKEPFIVRHALIAIGLQISITLLIPVAVLFLFFVYAYLFLLLLFDFILTLFFAISALSGVGFTFMGRN